MLTWKKLQFANHIFYKIKIKTKVHISVFLTILWCKNQEASSKRQNHLMSNKISYKRCTNVRMYWSTEYPFFNLSHWDAEVIFQKKREDNKIPMWFSNYFLKKIYQHLNLTLIQICCKLRTKLMYWSTEYPIFNL